MSTINLQMIGRFGNCAMQYMHARGLAERTGAELRTPRWAGERIFQIEPTPEPDYSGEFLHGYFQSQQSITYTKSDVQRWFRFQPWVDDAIGHLKPELETIVAHWRTGDYAGYGYPVVSQASYFTACDDHSLSVENLCFVTDAVDQLAFPGIPEELSFLPDFYILCHAKTILRGNSSFSWVAATISNARVFSPVIDGLIGGMEHQVPFVEGNHKKLADLDGITDMFVEP